MTNTTTNTTTNTLQIAKVLRDRFINWMHSQPDGMEMSTAEISEWLYLPDDSLVGVILAPAREGGIVKVRESQCGRMWSLA